MVETKIKVDYLARVEGEGNLYIKVIDGKVERLEVGIFEAPRFFEALLIGRRFHEAPDITARICGICPVAYIFSSCRAMEKLFNIKIPEEIEVLRKILYYAEWIQSHALHVFFLHAPDFLKVDSIMEIAKIHPEITRKALKLKAWGNRIIEIIGGRSVHPISCRIGGFYRIIKREELKEIYEKKEEMQNLAKELLEWIMTLNIPKMERDFENVSLRNDENEYPLIGGRVISNKGLNVVEEEFEKFIEEFQTPYSTALRYKIKGRGSYLTGPLARYNNNYDRIRGEVKETVEKQGYQAPLRNTFQSIIARAAEIYHATLEIGRLIGNYVEPQKPYIEVEVKSGTAYGITEAPRGILYHAYEVNEEGIIEKANIISPTAQNLAYIEKDLLELVPELLKMNYNDARLLAEQTIRNYDPCISCSTHFLKLKIERKP